MKIKNLFWISMVILLVVLPIIYSESNCGECDEPIYKVLEVDSQNSIINMNSCNNAYYMLDTNGYSCDISILDDLNSEIPSKDYSLYNQNDNLCSSSSTSTIINGKIKLKINRQNFNVKLQNCEMKIKAVDDTYTYDNSNVMSLNVLENDLGDKGSGINSVNRINEDGEIGDNLPHTLTNILYSQHFTVNNQEKLKYTIYSSDGITSSAIVTINYDNPKCITKNTCGDYNELINSKFNLCDTNLFKLRLPRNQECNINFEVLNSLGEDLSDYSLQYSKFCGTTYSDFENCEGSSCPFYKNDLFLKLTPTDNSKVYSMNAYITNCKTLDSTCKDFDVSETNPKNIAGYINITTGDGEVHSFFDKCIEDDSKIKEFNCNGNNPSHEKLNCPLGCEEVSINYNGEQEDSARCISRASTCFDSDVSETHSENVPGYVDHSNQRTYDFCISQNIINEKSCSGNNLISSEIQCSDGFSCKDTNSGAACIQDLSDDFDINLTLLNKIKFQLEKTIPSKYCYSYILGQTNSLDFTSDYYYYGNNILPKSYYLNLDSLFDPDGNNIYHAFPEDFSDYAVCPNDCIIGDTCSSDYINTHKSSEYCVYNKICYEENATINVGGINVKCDLS